MEMERLGMMRLKERTRAPRGKRSHTENSEQEKTNIRCSAERSRRHERSATDVTQNVMKSSASERSRERRSQRIVKSRSQTPDAFWSDDETERFKPVRKVATRRPRQRGNNEDRLPQKGSEQNEPRVGRPTRRRKRRRRKKDEDNDDEEEEEEEEEDAESLEEGVTWYEEDTCASAHCHRPAERRVQWVCCDDCDSWYHTVCVGIFLEDLKEDEDYHCGCV